MSEHDFCADYTTEEIARVFAGRDLHSWDDAIRWLDEDEAEAQTVHAEARKAMRDDFRQLERDEVPFTREPARVHALTHQERSRHREG